MLNASISLAPTGSNAVQAYSTMGVDRDDTVNVVQFVVDSAGTSPTVTFTIQGSFDGTHWFDVPYLTTTSDTLSNASLTLTATGAALLYVMRPFPFFRVNVTALNNVTFHADLFPVAD